MFKELCSLVNQIGRPDLALSLVVLSTTPLPPTVNACSVFHSVNAFDSHSGQQKGATSTTTCSSATHWLALCAVACAGLVRRLGRSLAPALPRLVPRVFIRRFDIARPRMRQAIQMVWLGLILYATPNASAASSSSSTAAAAASAMPNAANTGLTDGESVTSPSLNSMASDLVNCTFVYFVIE